MKIIVISVVRNFDMYNKCIADNPYLNGCELVAIDNRTRNDGLSQLYNQFLASRAAGEDAWYVFCHEDFEMNEPLSPLLQTADKFVIHGPCGARRKCIFPISYWEVAGRITETWKDFSHPHPVGKKRKAGLLLDTLDCMCLVVHATVCQNLRFDEKLTFDLYVEDFCASALVKENIPTRLLNMKCTHHSTRTELPQQYYESNSYLNTKYRTTCFAGTCSYFGGNKFARNFKPLACLFNHLILPLFRNSASDMLL